MLHGKMKFLVAFAIFVFSFMGCTDQTNRNTLTGYEVFFLSRKQQKEYMKLATNGDGVAAYKLAMHYGRIESDYEKAMDWFFIGENNGNTDCIFELSLIMISSKEKNEIKKGYDKMKIAASLGNKGAENYLLQVNKYH